ncbi:hypothetical protein GGS23DRAFT_230294 [Durotheca rogersii]|uniref:uncharacterized protein n=1 Tax=Durotheca rogersii TaxID=419775 RepID=UPI00221EABE1|nr:uncharacterized protein GGS23DRAFT_230294 [Durotheca rogersii]KAI5860594.1 hypothetical protein GGS23DRAFT_230294 [Durotheca rogersii]
MTAVTFVFLRPGKGNQNWPDPPPPIHHRPSSSSPSPFIITRRGAVGSYLAGAVPWQDAPAHCPLSRMIGEGSLSFTGSPSRPGRLLVNPVSQSVSQSASQPAWWPMLATTAYTQMYVRTHAHIRDADIRVVKLCVRACVRACVCVCMCVCVDAVEQFMIIVSPTANRSGLRACCDMMTQSAASIAPGNSPAIDRCGDDPSYTHTRTRAPRTLAQVERCISILIHTCIYMYGRLCACEYMHNTA